jgi:hypothetical protein
MVVNPLEAILLAIPNGEKRDKVTAGILSGRRAAASRRKDVPGAIQLPPLTDEEWARPTGQGVLPGAADMALLISLGRTVWVETKIPKTALHKAGTLSDDQKRFRRIVLALGHDYRVCLSTEEYRRSSRNTG